jgi:predicted porin
MKTTLRLTCLAMALVCAFPAAAQSNADVLNELKALRDRVAELERKLQAAEAAKPKDGQWGMTPEQSRELNRVTVKTEALEDNRDALGFKGLKISGYMDPTFIYNKNQNTSGFQFLNKVDTANGGDGYNYDNSYFGAAVIDFQKETDSGVRWRLTLAPNRGVGAVFDGTSPVHEASVSIPLGSLQQRLIVGQLPDWSGYEYLPATQNKLITHNLLFDFTLPTAYTGVGFEITEGKWIVKSMLNNMNASRKSSGNTTPALAYRVDYSKGEFQGFGFAGVHGKATNFNDPNGRDSRLDLFEADAYFIRGDVTLQGQVSYGQQKRASITPDPTTGDLRNASWTGFSVLGAYKFMPRLEGIARLDYVRNRKNGGGLLGYTVSDGRNGFGPDANLGCDPATLASLVPECDRGASRSALSFGLSYLFDSSTTFKAEYRIDRADLPVFEVVRDGTFKKTNQLFGASVLVSF